MNSGDNQASHPPINDRTFHKIERTVGDVIGITDTPPKEEKSPNVNKSEVNTTQEKSEVEDRNSNQEDDDEIPAVILSNRVSNNPMQEQANTRIHSFITHLAPTTTPTPTTIYIPFHILESDCTIVSIPTTTLNLTTVINSKPELEVELEHQENLTDVHKEDGRTVLLFILQEVIEKSGLISLLDKHLRKESLLDIENH